jgi:hypothetical protein
VSEDLPPVSFKSASARRGTGSSFLGGAGARGGGREAVRCQDRSGIYSSLDEDFVDPKTEFEGSELESSIDLKTPLPSVHPSIFLKKIHSHEFFLAAILCSSMV